MRNPTVVDDPVLTTGPEHLDKFVKAYDATHEFIIVVCHMNVIRYFVARALQLPPETWLRMRGDNCGITEIIVTPKGQASLGRFADTGHLSIEQTTFH